MARSKTYISLINSSTWRKLRRQVLTDHPLCQRCEVEGRLRSATEVHHIVPVESSRNPAEMKRLAYSPSNLRPLCHECHVLTHREMFKRARQSRKETIREETDSAIAKLFGGSDRGGCSSKMGEGVRNPTPPEEGNAKPKNQTTPERK